MLNGFLSTYDLTSGQLRESGADNAPTVEQLLARCGGCSFERGLYRIHSDSTSEAATSLVTQMFPAFADRVAAFGFDWLGRQFCVDLRGSVEDPPVLLFEPGTGEVLEIPVEFSAFHDEELVDFSDAALALPFFREWLAASGAGLTFEQCAGYKVPLFLGGADTVDNLEVIDIDVYWTLTAQLWKGTRRLTPGTTIAQLRVDL